jgi:hypothetical protein
VNLERLSPLAERSPYATIHPLLQIIDASRIQLRFDDGAARRWPAEYHYLTREQVGLLGAVLARAEAQVLRIAVTYALLDGATLISAEHLSAALAVWRYAESSARYIFGDALGDDTADTILSFLRSNRPNGVTRTEVSKLFGRNKDSAEIERALRVLADTSLARSLREEPEAGGRPTERWQAIYD